MTDSLNDFTKLLSAGMDLPSDQIPFIANLLIDDREDNETKCEFLKNYLPKEKLMRNLPVLLVNSVNLQKPHLDDYSDRAIDLCGTGGDRSGSFNISTFVSLVVATAGVPVIKHGNRSISSNCGSADLLEALGIPMETDPDKLEASLAKLNFCFLFIRTFIPPLELGSGSQKIGRGWNYYNV